MSKQDGTQAAAPQRPTTSDREAWKSYWKAQRQSWRIEPEIDTERQKFLKERLTISVNTVQGIFPFKNVRMNRADLEWLLATHENGRGPVDWSDISQRERVGIDLRGAVLNGINVYDVDLSNLPLARMLGGLQTADLILAIDLAMEGGESVEEQINAAAVHLELVRLNGAHLEGAFLCGADLRHATLCDVHLERACLENAHLEEANLAGAYVQEALFDEAHLKEARLWKAHAENARFNGANMEHVSLCQASLNNVHLFRVNLEEADLEGVHLKGAHLENVHLRGAKLKQAHLEESRFPNVRHGSK